MSDGDVSVEASSQEPPLDLRNLLWRTGWSLAALFALLLFVGLLFEQELQALAARAEESFGLAGLVLLVFGADSFTLPIPPDFALLIVANGPRREDWHWIVPLLGLVSTLGGIFGYGIGIVLARLPSVARVRRVILGRHFAFVQRYGWVAVAIGALTPIPFSITCYTAGAIGVRPSGFLVACSLRIPRFLAYYLVFAYATRLSALLGSGN